MLTENFQFVGLTDEHAVAVVLHDDSHQESETCSRFDLSSSVDTERMLTSDEISHVENSNATLKSRGQRLCGILSTALTRCLLTHHKVECVVLPHGVELGIVLHLAGQFLSSRHAAGLAKLHECGGKLEDGRPSVLPPAALPL